MKKLLVIFIVICLLISGFFMFLIMKDKEMLDNDSLKTNLVNESGEKENNKQNNQVIDDDFENITDEELEAQRIQDEIDAEKEFTPEEVEEMIKKEEEDIKKYDMENNQEAIISGDEEIGEDFYEEVLSPQEIMNGSD